jgi:glycosyltransferase involved in cell wall biosynthesis
VRLANESMMIKPLLLIDFLSGGHHESYVCHMVRFGLAHNQENLHFLVSRALYDGVRSELSPQEINFFSSRARVIEDTAAWLHIKKWTTSRFLAQWFYIEYLNLREGKTFRLLYLFLESVIYPLALCPIPRRNTLGIMFRPTFYYKERRMLASGTRPRILFSIKWMVAYLLAKRPGFDRIFLFDPLADTYAHTQWGSERFNLIPDPLRANSREHCRASKSLRTDRQRTLLMAGALHPRKGLHLAVEALAKSCEKTRKSVRVMFAGLPESGSDEYVMNNISRLKGLGVEVDADLRFMSDLELDEYIERSDVVLIPYVGFKGSSGILIHAAYFGKPVISSNDGLIGYLVPKHNLGAAIDLADGNSFSACLHSFISTGYVSGFDPVSARSFANRCSPEEFARALAVAV